MDRFRTPPAMPCCSPRWVLLLAMGLALATAAPAQDAGRPAPERPATAAARDPESASTRERLERLRGTGSRTGFRHDTRPGALQADAFGASQGVRAGGEDAAAERVAPRPTRWKQKSVGGRTVREVRFRREGKDGDGAR